MIELFKKYPKSAKLIKEYFNKAFLESLNSSENIDKEFLDQVKKEGYQAFTEESLAKMLDNNPRSLFDLFDENKLFLIIYIDRKDMFPNIPYFKVTISNSEGIIHINTLFYNTRKEAEKEAVKEAMKLLEDKL